MSYLCYIVAIFAILIMNISVCDKSNSSTYNLKSKRKKKCYKPSVFLNLYHVDLALPFPCARFFRSMTSIFWAFMSTYLKIRVSNDVSLRQTLKLFLFLPAGKYIFKTHLLNSKPNNTRFED